MKKIVGHILIAVWVATSFVVFIVIFSLFYKPQKGMPEGVAHYHPDGSIHPIGQVGHPEMENELQSSTGGGNNYEHTSVYPPLVRDNTRHEHFEEGETTGGYTTHEHYKVDN